MVPEELCSLQAAGTRNTARKKSRPTLEDFSDEENIPELAGVGSQTGAADGGLPCHENEPVCSRPRRKRLPHSVKPLDLRAC